MRESMLIDGMFIGGFLMFLGVLLGACIRSRKGRVERRETYQIEYRLQELMV